MVNLRTFLFALLTNLVWGAAVSGAAEIDFTRDIRPLLSENCFHCHGPDGKARKGDLRLDDESDSKRNRDGYRVIRAGSPAKSELLVRLRHSDPDSVMPPPDSNRSLNEAEISLIEEWIDQGAKWGEHWAFTKAERPDSRSSEEAHPIDALIAPVLKRESIVPAESAEPTELIRRLSLDLTGLPPTPEEVQQFISNEDPEAWSELIDYYLNSTAFGERMAWDWLDAARYADTNGYQGDRERTMWPWRDWVVRAYNENLPFDQFTTWQLAGDLLPEASEDQILATGFNRNHMINGEGGRIPEENRVDYVMDMTETMGTVWMGLTLNCCRCHDHKFDPLSQKDYYGLYAIFNQTPVSGGGGDPQTKPVLAVASEEEKQNEAKLRFAYEEMQKKMAILAKQIRPEQSAWEKNQRGETKWQPLKPESAAAKSVTLTMRPDHTVFASGANPDKDTYTIRLKNKNSEAQALRLEALQDPSFTNEGKGLARSDSGNFVLTEFELKVNNQPVKWKTARATFEQRSFPVKNAFDGDATTGWAVHESGGVKRPHQAIFFPENPIPPQAELLLTLRHDSRYTQHILGRFRISVTPDLYPKIVGEESDFLTAIRKEPAQRSKEETALIGQRFRNSHPEYAKLKRESDAAKKQLDSHLAKIPKVMVMEDLATPRKTNILQRGIYNQPGEEVPAAVPTIFSPLPAGESANRLALSRWLTDRENPLTARVTVNRLWKMLFGTGLVKTVEDFGVQSEYPLYAELLDWLAVEFVESGWDRKHLLKTILQSETYRRSSRISSQEMLEIDPDNRFLARGPRYRLASWMIRDQALAAAGLLNREMGGPSIQGYQPPGIWEEATFGKKKYVQAKGTDLYRRSLYLFWRRIVGPTMFFDAAKRQVCEIKTSQTNTPMHALATLNDVTYVEASRHLATRVMGQRKTEDERLRLAGQLILSREPSEKELVIWKRALQRARENFLDSKEQAESFLRENGDSQSHREDPAPIETASLATVALMLMNLDEALSRE